MILDQPFVLGVRLALTHIVAARPARPLLDTSAILRQKVAIGRPQPRIDS